MNAIKLQLLAISIFGLETVHAEQIVHTIKFPSSSMKSGISNNPPPERVVEQPKAIDHPEQSKPDTSESLSSPERKTYPYTNNHTYTSTYRNTSKERALETMHSQRAKFEATFNAHAKSWKAANTSAPVCGSDGPKNEYWICEITVTYSGESYLSPDSLAGPAKVSER